MVTNTREQIADDIILVAGTTEDLHVITARMREDFPASELKSKEQFERLMSGGSYRLWLAKSRSEGEFLGYAFVFEPVSPNILWLDYFAIEKRLRRKGYGAQFFDRLLRTGNHESSGMLMEVEIADSDDSATREMQERRICFYRRLGAIELAVPYVFPATDPPTPMSLYFKPAPEARVLQRSQLQEVIEAAYDYIHADVPHRGVVLRQFVSAITDQRFS